MNDNGLESRLRDYGQLLDEAASDHEPGTRPIAAPRRIERRALVLAGTAAALVAAALGINGVVGSNDSGREVQVSSGGGAEPRQQTDCPAPTGERIRAVARTGERLRVETLPDGFTLTSGDEADPAGAAELTYGKREDPAGPRVQLSRRLSSQPAEQFISGEGKSPQQIRGHSGAISGGGPGSEFTTAAWNETPDIVITLTGYRLGRAETLQVADGVHYEPGAAGETVAVMPSEAPTECRTLPPQTLSRRDVADRFPGAQTKLVRLSQITQSPQFAGLCSSATCTEGLVVWAALRQGPPGSFPHSCPPGAPPEACSGSWQLVIIDAAGRASGYGTNIGNGPPPPEFAVWEDLAP